MQCCRASCKRSVHFQVLEYGENETNARKLKNKRHLCPWALRVHYNVRFAKIFSCTHRIFWEKTGMKKKIQNTSIWHNYNIRFELPKKSFRIEYSTYEEEHIEYVSQQNLSVWYLPILRSTYLNSRIDLTDAKHHTGHPMIKWLEYFSDSDHTQDLGHRIFTWWTFCNNLRNLFEHGTFLWEYFAVMWCRAANQTLSGQKPADCFLHFMFIQSVAFVKVNIFVSGITWNESN